MKPLLARLWEKVVAVVEGVGLQASRTGLCMMSWELADLLGGAVGTVFHVVCLPRRAVALRNLRTAFGSRLSFRAADGIARQACVHLIQSMFQFLRLPAMSPDEIRSRVQLVGTDNYWQAAGRERGVIILTAHFGNWELLGARLALEGIPMTVIARYRSNQVVDAILRETRRAAHMQIIDKEAAMLAAARTLRARGVLGVLPDQHAGHQGLPIPFFGRVTPMHPVVARLARQTGAAVVPIYCVRERGHCYRAKVYPMLELQRTRDKQADILANTERMTRLLEEQIRQHPDQWLWVHKRWRAEDYLFTHHRFAPRSRDEGDALELAGEGMLPSRLRWR